MRFTRPIPCALAALALLVATRAAADGPYASASATGIWQDNVTNATAGDGVLSAFTIETSGNLTWIKSVDFSTMLSGGGSATADICTTFSGLNSISAGPRIELRHKLGLGPYAPVISIGVQTDGVAFSDSSRSNVDAAVVAQFSQRFNDAVQVVVDARCCGYSASNDVFSGRYVRLGATLNWDVDETWRLFVTGNWRDGDIVANYAAEKSPLFGWVPIDTGGYNYSGPRLLVRTFSEPFIAYRANAPAVSWGAGISPAIGAHTSLVLQYTRCRTSAYDAYVNDLVSIGVVHHF
jgi:hypothetical protein